MTDRYILDDDGNPVAEPDLMRWARWFEKTESRRVAADQIGDVFVSTVFLGLNHRFGEGPPLLFETMIFGGPHKDWMDRYETRQEAIEGHNRAVFMVSESQSK